MSPRRAPRPLIVRVVLGDIVDAEASVIVVNHFSGLAPSGAERAIDRVLGGAISRLAARGALESHLGATHFLPAANAPLAAESVLLVGLGEPETFVPDRLGEVGAAMVQAFGAFRVRDAATILHGGGTARVERTRAARLLLEGMLRALAQLPEAACFRELVIVEREQAALEPILAGLRAARGPASIRLHLELTDTAPPAAPETPETSPPPVDPGEPALPRHLRIGLTVAGSDLKVTVIGLGGFDPAATAPYPAQMEQTLLRNLETEVLREPDPAARATRLESIGAQYYTAFMGAADTVGIPAELAKLTSGYLVVRVDRATSALPIELFCLNGRFLSRDYCLARQIELNAPGRAAALPPPRARLRVLVIGDPRGDLPAASAEAAAVEHALRGLGADVTRLPAPVSYAQCSAALDDGEFDVVHYAGHARFDPLRGGALVLADRDLTAEDLATRTHLPRVLFANACYSAQTAGDDADNVFSGWQPTRDLVSGLLRSGVRAFIGACWAVDDVAAATFARGFYAALGAAAPSAAAPRASIGEAIRLAREAVIREHGLGQPAWAAYALYGSPWAAL